MALCNFSKFLSFSQLLQGRFHYSPVLHLDNMKLWGLNNQDWVHGDAISQRLRRLPDGSSVETSYEIMTVNTKGSAYWMGSMFQALYLFTWLQNIMGQHMQKAELGTCLGYLVRHYSKVTRGELWGFIAWPHFVFFLPPSFSPKYPPLLPVCGWVCDQLLFLTPCFLAVALLPVCGWECDQPVLFLIPCSLAVAVPVPSCWILPL